MNNFFDINSVVVIWASQNTWKIWNDILKNLKTFEWEKYWVNPKWWSFEWIIFYESIDLLPIIPDIAVITIPSDLVINSLIECSKKLIKRVIIISAWFKEIWNIEWENSIKEIAKKYSIRILWPNCLWYVDVHKKLNLSFWWKEIIPWNVAMISQSWAMAVALEDLAKSSNVWFSKIISMWNKSDLNENDLLQALENDSQTEVIVMYLESLEDWRRFYEITKKLTKKKPIILLKSWISNRWKQAASSHTWALSWEDKILEVAFRDAWIHTTQSLEDLFLWSESFSKTVWKEIPDDIVIVTNAGWPWVIATDHCEINNISLKDFSKEEQIILKNNLPESTSMKNPLDIIWDATSKRYRQILENISKVSNNTWILIILTPQTVTDVDNIANEIVYWKNKNPNFFIMTSFIWWSSVENAHIILDNNKILDYDFSKEAIESLSRLLKQKKWLKIPIQEDIKIIEIEKNKINELKRELQREKKLCSIELIYKIFNSFEVPFLEEKISYNTEDIEKMFNGAKNKLVAKIVSKDIAHKTDCSWVIAWISTKKDAIEAYENILKNVKNFHPNAEIIWVSFQEMLPKSKEVFLGFKRDISFWDILIVWIGWIFVNVYEDVYMKISLVSKIEIKEMFTKLKWYSILNWARWDIPIDFDSLVDIVFKLMSIFQTFHEIKEIDINPVFANEKWSIVVDAKFYL